MGQKTGRIRKHQPFLFSRTCSLLVGRSTRARWQSEFRHFLYFLPQQINQGLLFCRCKPSLDVIKKELKGAGIFPSFQLSLSVPQHCSCCFQVAWHISEHILKPRDTQNLCPHMGECTRCRSQLAPNNPSHLCPASCAIIYCSIRHSLWHLWHFYCYFY